MKSISAKETVEEAFSTIKSNFSTIALAGLGSFAILYGPQIFKSLLFISIHGTPTTKTLQEITAHTLQVTPVENITGLLISLLSLFTSWPIAIGLNRLFLDIYSGKKATVSTLFYGFTNGSNYYLRCVLTPLLIGLIIAMWTLAVVAATGISYWLTGYFTHNSMISGLLAGVVACAGLIFIINKCFNYVLTPFVIANDTNIKAMEAIDKSTELIKNNQWSFFKLTCVLFLCYLPIAIVGGIMTPWILTQDLQGGSTGSLITTIGIVAPIAAVSLITAQLLSIGSLVNFYLKTVALRSQPTQ